MPGPEHAEPAPAGRRQAWRARTWSRLAVAAPVAACHMLLLMMLGAPTTRTPTPEPEVTPATVAAILIQPPPTPDAPGGAPAAATRSPSPAPPRPAPTAPTLPLTARPPRVPPTPDVETLTATPAPAAETGVILGEDDLAGAMTAGGGQGGAGGGAGGGSGPGAGCDMTARLQQALRADPDIRGAVARSHASLGPGGRALLIWNGEWLRSPGQDGKGLAGVRQAIAMEVAFAPEVCRAQPMRGLVVIAFGDGPDSPRLALGARDWRWSQLLSARR